MARIRSLKPEFWHDRGLAKRTSRDARMLYMALWNIADEHSRCAGDPRYIKGQCFPYDDDLDVDEIKDLLSDLAAAGKVQPYTSDGDPFLFLPRLDRHQRLEPGKVESRHPAPPAPETVRVDDPGVNGSAPDSDHGADESARDADEAEKIVALHGACSRGQVGPTQDVDADESPPKPHRATRFTRDLITDEWRDYARTAGFTDPGVTRMLDDFADYWTARAGRDGSKLDWLATWRRWVRNEADRNPPRVAASAGIWEPS